MDEVGGEYEVHTLRFRLGQNLAQSLQGGRMRVANGDRFAFFAGAAQGSFQLLPDSGYLRNIVEEWDIPKRGWNPVLPRNIESDRRNGCAAVNVEELALSQNRHELGH
jgi:hypothetical protein